MRWAQYFSRYPALIAENNAIIAKLFYSEFVKGIKRGVWHWRKKYNQKISHVERVFDPKVLGSSQCFGVSEFYSIFSHVADFGKKNFKMGK